ncbi:hypothetical protein J2T06_001004 [Enterobacter ludwigii]|nr:hypothetical protein [Enterobacter ludwigii]
MHSLRQFGQDNLSGTRQTLNVSVVTNQFYKQTDPIRSVGIMLGNM